MYFIVVLPLSESVSDESSSLEGSLFFLVFSGLRLCTVADLLLAFLSFFFFSPADRCSSVLRFFLPVFLPLGSSLQLISCSSSSTSSSPSVQVELC